MNYILTIKGDLIQIWYNNSVVYEKTINNAKKRCFRSLCNLKKVK